MASSMSELFERSRRMGQRHVVAAAGAGLWTSERINQSINQTFTPWRREPPDQRANEYPLV
jgi:hypothetical protein